MHPLQRDKWIQDEHHKTFGGWLKRTLELHIGDPNIDEDLKWLARGPTNMPFKYNSIIINGHRFSTKARDDLRVNQNSGVGITARTMQISSSKDKSPHYGVLTFYGVIQEIWELDYCAFRIAVFKCQWVDVNGGVKKTILDSRL